MLQNITVILEKKIQAKTEWYIKGVSSIRYCPPYLKNWFYNENKIMNAHKIWEDTTSLQMQQLKRDHKSKTFRRYFLIGIEISRSQIVLSVLSTLRFSCISKSFTLTYTSKMSQVLFDKKKLQFSFLCLW